MAHKDGDWQGTRQRPDAPVPVWIKLAYVLPPSPRPGGLDGIPLRVRAAGIDITKIVPGVLLAWHQTITGDWWALVTFELTNRSRRPGLVVTQLVPPAAVRQRQS
ncbi:hypothetical protein [Saccharopolyspora sp. NPDC049426]|uniref:hypothetical protein n=1 Tax=Saccharopolyspora sp. NPDC049426 TaxID=3155652 RepID=UPI00343340D7